MRTSLPSSFASVSMDTALRLRWSPERVRYTDLLLRPQKIQWITQVFEILRLTLGKRAREVEKVAKQLEVEGTMLRGGGLMELEGDREGGEVEGLGRQLAEKAKMAEES